MHLFDNEVISEKSIRLEQVREALKINKSELARRIGSPQSHISKVLKGEVAIGENLSEKIIKRLHINSVWWELGVGEMLVEKYPYEYVNSPVRQMREQKKAYDNARLVGVYDPDLYRPVPIVRYGVWASFVDNFDSFDFDGVSDTYPVYLPDVDGEITGKHMVFEVLGDSMEPTVMERAKVLAELVDEGNFEYLNGAVYIVAYRNHLVLKRIIDNELLLNGTLMLHSDNTLRGKFSVRREDIRYVWHVLNYVGGKIR